MQRKENLKRDWRVQKLGNHSEANIPVSAFLLRQASLLADLIQLQLNLLLLKIQTELTIFLEKPLEHRSEARAPPAFLLGIHFLVFQL